LLPIQARVHANTRSPFFSLARGGLYNRTPRWLGSCCGATSNSMSRHSASPGIDAAIKSYLGEAEEISPKAVDLANAGDTVAFTPLWTDRWFGKDRGFRLRYEN